MIWLRRAGALLSVLLFAISASATTVTGEFALNFVPLGNANPYTNGSLTYGTADQHQILGNVATPTGFTGRTRHYYNGTVSSTLTIRAKIEVGANPGGSDDIVLWIAQTGGTGYYCNINGTLANITHTSGGPLNSTTLGTAPVSGDQLVCELNQSTHALTLYVNGTNVLTTTDSTTTTGLTFGYGFFPNNSNAATVKSFAGDGLPASGTTVTPAAASLSLTGSTPTVTTNNNKTAAPAAASLALTGATPTITAQNFTWYTLPAPGGYDSNSILAGQTYPTGSWLRVVTGWAHITSVYSTGPLQNNINDYSTAQSGYTGSDTATYEIKTPALSTSQYTITASIDASSLIGFTAASAVISSATPSVIVGKYISPAAAALALSPATPTITKTANVVLLPSSVALALSSATPSISVTGGAILAPASASLAITPVPPAVAATANKAVSPASVAMALSASTPTITRTTNAVLAPAAATLSLTPSSPGITAGGNVSVSPAGAALAAAASTPAMTRTTNYAGAPGVAALAVTGSAPSIIATGNGSILPAMSALGFAGAVPSILATKNIAVSPQPATMSFSALMMWIKTTTHTFVLPPTGTAIPSYRQPNQRRNNRPAVLE